MLPISPTVSMETYDLHSLLLPHCSPVTYSPAAWPAPQPRSCLLLSRTRSGPTREAPGRPHAESAFCGDEAQNEMQLRTCRLSTQTPERCKRIETGAASLLEICPSTAMFAVNPVIRRSLKM